MISMKSPASEPSAAQPGRAAGCSLPAPLGVRGLLRGRFLPALDAPEGHGRADGAGAGVARLVRRELLEQRERGVAADDPLAARAFYFSRRQRAGVDRRALCRELGAVPHDEQARLRRLLVLAELDEPQVRGGDVVQWCIWLVELGAGLADGPR